MISFFHGFGLVHGCVDDDALLLQPIQFGVVEPEFGTQDRAGVLRVFGSAAHHLARGRVPYRRIGSARTGLPVSLSIALATAGAIGGVPGSPTPPGNAAEGTMWVSISGAPAMRSMS